MARTSLVAGLLALALVVHSAPSRAEPTPPDARAPVAVQTPYAGKASPSQQEGGASAKTPSPVETDGEHLNVVLIVVDDLGWADLGCYGADLHETPHIDALAQQGMRFTDAYAAAPICSPTRASIMTGKYPARLGMTIWYEASRRPPPTKRPLIPPPSLSNLPHAEVTLAERLAQLGYLTAHVGKWHLGDAEHYPETQGFDINVGGTHWGAPPTYFFPYRGRWGNSDEIRYVPDLPFGSAGEYLTDRLTDEALAVIRRAGKRPFFLHLAYHSVHTPIEAVKSDVEYFAARIQPDGRHRNATYAAMVRSVDRNVGRILQGLADMGLAQNTLVVLTSDNGGYVNAHRGQVVTNNAPLRSGKGSLYEGGVRVPLIVRWPGVSGPGSVCREPVVSTDLHATIADVAGAPKVDDLPPIPEDARSLVPLLRDPAAHLDRKAIYFHYPHYYPTTTPVGAIRAGRWKLLEYFEDGRIELYDLEHDLGEQHDLAAEKPDVAARLQGDLRRWRKSVGAKMPEPRSAAAGRS